MVRRSELGSGRKGPLALSCRENSLAQYIEEQPWAPQYDERKGRDTGNEGDGPTECLGEVEEAVREVQNPRGLRQSCATDAEPSAKPL